MKKTLKEIIFKYIYAWPIVITFTLFLINLKWDLFSNFLDMPDTWNTLASTSGVLVGFLLTGITFFASTPKNTEYMKRFEKSHHDKIFKRTCSLAIILFTVVLALWIFQTFNVKVALYFFVAGFLEVLVMFYYTLHISFSNAWSSFFKISFISITFGPLS